MRVVNWMKPIALIVALAASPVSAKILVDQAAANVYGEYYVGSGDQFGWLDFTNSLAAQDGGYQIGSVANAADVADADAILLVARTNFGTSSALSAQEIANLTNFLATGGRVAIIGDGTDFLFGNWTNSIINFASGGNAAVTYGVSGTATAIAGYELTDGVSSVLLQGAGSVPGSVSVTGGTALFTPNWATLWGDQNNLLTVLDVNALTRFPGAAFRDNIADWLGDSSPVAVPEPATWAMMIVGFGVVGSAMRRKQRLAAATA